MAFHDCYTNIEIDDDSCTEYQQALSDIGEALDARFRLEDQLIQWAAESWQAAQLADADKRARSTDRRL